MDTLLDAYREEEDDDDSPPETTTTTTATTIITTTSITESHIQNGIPNDSTTSPSEDDGLSIDHPKSTNNTTTISDEEENPLPKKQKTLSSLPDSNGEVELATPMLSKVMRPSSKKTKKKNTTNSVWTKSTSRKGKKKTKTNNPNTPSANGVNEDRVLITPVPRLPEKTDDTPDMGICLSKVHKAEKVELSDDRLAAGSSKGYRMVRATRGVMEGAWYFEIRVLKLGDTGHSRLGWSNEKGDLQAPVGYDSNSFGYRDVDGSKVHKALREKYGEEGYKEGDVIGFYINLPEGGLFAPKPPHFVWYKGQKFLCAPDAKEDPPKIVPGSEISFFKNGVCQGVAFSDVFGGRYYPAASMYTMPNQPNCVVKFNFGPDFEFFPENLDGRSVPKPMIEVPYHGYDSQVENGVPEEKNL